MRSATLAVAARVGRDNAKNADPAFLKKIQAPENRRLFQTRQGLRDMVLPPA